MALTLTQYVTRVRQYLREASASQSFWSDAFLKNMFNARYKKRCAELVMAFEGFFRNEVQTPIVQGQSFYDWPDGFQRCYKLELLSSAGTRYPIARSERHGVISSKVFGNVVPNYRPVDGGIILEPAPDFGITKGMQILESFDTDPASALYTATHCTLGTVTDLDTIKEGEACILLSISNDGFPPLVEKTLAAPITLDTDTTTVGTWVFIPSLGAGGGGSTLIILKLISGAVSVYNFTKNECHLGWNNLSALISSAVTPPSGPITGVQVSYNLITQPCLWDAVYVNATEDVDYHLVLEYAGVPADLGDNDVLSIEFPKIFEELLILDTAVAAMAAEGMLEGGQVRALLRERTEFELGFEQFINQRVISRQRIEPFAPHYQDA